MGLGRGLAARTFIRLHVEHAVARLLGAKGPMKPPRSGRAMPSGHTRSRVRPCPPTGAGAPHAVHGSRIISAAAPSAIANGTHCSAASLWYWRRRAICGSTLDVAAWREPPVRSATFCSIERRHLEQSIASPPPPLEGGGRAAEGAAALKN